MIQFVDGPRVLHSFSELTDEPANRKSIRLMDCGLTLLTPPAISPVPVSCKRSVEHNKSNTSQTYITGVPI